MASPLANTPLWPAAGRSGDEIVVTIPLQLRTESTDDRKDIQALFYGPTVLNALNPSTKFIQRGFTSATAWMAPSNYGRTEEGRHEELLHH